MMYKWFAYKVTQKYRKENVEMDDGNNDQDERSKSKSRCGKHK